MARVRKPVIVNDGPAHRLLDGKAIFLESYHRRESGRERGDIPRYRVLDGEGPIFDLTGDRRMGILIVERPRHERFH